MATAFKHEPKPLPVPHGDFYDIESTLNAAERAIRKKVRDFMANKVQPIINDYWIRDEFPFELIEPLEDLDIGGLNVGNYTARLKGLVAMEIARVDASSTTFSVSTPALPWARLHCSVRGAKAEVAPAVGPPPGEFARAITDFAKT